MMRPFLTSSDEADGDHSLGPSTDHHAVRTPSAQRACGWMAHDLAVTVPLSLTSKVCQPRCAERFLGGRNIATQ
jgi:hypothetical protein